MNIILFRQQSFKHCFYSALINIMKKIKNLLSFSNLSEFIYFLI
ncbi:hypothetical protein HMPREF0022_02143 [Acinetobacter baumannii 6014059]|uniref:Uncharacterized protein n=1 Tax=Acinetobacter baumannii 6014059 TaxID=525242 RepID=A0A828STA5_ACIBA|nr:hypothetical protein HMPREF0022_02143 [Acinetobacter baumannii 6014059]ETR88454.1 hypothetical protein M212_1736 [Acinetobacter baumannii CI79]